MTSNIVVYLYNKKLEKGQLDHLEQSIKILEEVKYRFPFEHSQPRKPRLLFVSLETPLDKLNNIIPIKNQPFRQKLSKYFTVSIAALPSM